MFSLQFFSFVQSNKELTVIGARSRASHSNNTSPVESNSAMEFIRKGFSVNTFSS